RLVVHCHRREVRRRVGFETDIVDRNATSSAAERHQVEQQRRRRAGRQVIEFDDERERVRDVDRRTRYEVGSFYDGYVGREVEPTVGLEIDERVPTRQSDASQRGRGDRVQQGDLEGVAGRMRIGCEFGR